MQKDKEVGNTKSYAKNKSLVKPSAENSEMKMDWRAFENDPCKQ